MLKAVEDLEEEGRFEDAVIALLDQVEQAPEASVRQALLERASELFEARLNHPANAFEVLLQAFAEAPDDARFARPLARLAARAQRMDALLDGYELALAGVGDTYQAIPYHRRLADWYELAGREEDALRHWKALALVCREDPEAARQLEQRLEQRGDHRGLVELLSGRAERTTEPAARRALERRVARLLTDKLGAPKEALAYLGRRYVSEPDEALELTLEELAAASEDYAAYAKLLEQVIKKTERSDRAGATARLLKLASLYETTLKDSARARLALTKALTLEPDQERALLALEQLLLAQGAHTERLSVLTRLAELASTREDRYRRHVELGDAHKALGGVKAAVAAWFKALNAKADDRQVLSRLLDAYGETGQWSASVTVLKKLASLEHEPAKRARFLYAIGMIQRDELKDPQQAVRTLDKALDADPTLVKAFEAIDKLLTSAQDFERQDRYYRKMLVRALEHNLPEPVVEAVARNLGEINRTRLSNFDEALKAYQLALKLKPEDRELHAIVAELLVLTGNLEGAVSAFLGMLEQDPTDEEPYHQLAKLYSDAGKPDLAWCACQVLSLSGNARPDELRFYEAGRRQGGRIKRPLDAMDWRFLGWAGRSEALDQVLLTVSPVLPARADLKKLGVNPKRDLLAGEALGSLARALAYVQQVTGLAAGELYAAPVPGLVVAPVEPPALLVGPDVLTLGLEHQVFLAARALYLQSRQHRLVAMEPDGPSRLKRLETVLTHLFKVINPAVVLPAEEPKLLAALRSLPASHLETMARLGPALTVESLLPWLKAVEHSANRLGLLLCHDLRVAVRCLHAQTQPLLELSVEERVGPLLLFGVSAQYGELRRRLGLALGA